MTDILIRICVGVCGLMLFAGGVGVIADAEQKWAGCIGVVIGLITILRALGVL